MKRLYTSVILLLSFCLSYGQQGPAPQPPVQSLGNANNQVVVNGILRADTSIVLKTNYADTGTLNLGRYMKNMPGTIVKVNDELWMRNTTATAWIPAGGQTLNTQNSNTIAFSGIGSFNDPLTGTAVISGQPGNIIQSLSDGVFVPNSIQNGLIDGGKIIWVSGYTYDVVQTTAAIQGVVYVAPEIQVTLANADPTLDRRDLVVINSNSTISVITGAPADDPQDPSYDPLTQYPIGFIFVTANTTEPVPVPTQEWIYQNYGLVAWNTATSTARINDQSLVNPYSVPTDIEATLGRNTDFITFTDPSPPTTMSSFKVLTFKIFSKLAWDATSAIVFRWKNGASFVGNEVRVSDGSYGFNSGQTATYQTIAIALPQFGALTDVTDLQLTISTQNGNTIGFYIDDIQLQDAIVPFTGSYFQQNGNDFGTTAVLGTTDNDPLDIITNQVRRVSFLTSGITDFKSTNGTTSIVNISPTNGGQLRLGSSTAILPSLILNHAVAGSNSNNIIFQAAGSSQGSLQQISANTLHYNFDTHIWRSTNTLTDYGRINSSGEFLINETDAGDFKLQVEGGVRLDATGKEITLVGLDTDNTATQVLGIDGSGNSVWRDVSSFGGISSITADNGLTANTSTNVQWGGTLIQNTLIDGGANKIDFTSTYNGAGTYAYYFSNSVGWGIRATAAAYPIAAFASGGASFFGQNTAGNILQASGSSSGTSDVLSNVILTRVTSGVSAQNGIGQSIDFWIEQSAGSSSPSNGIVSKWTDATESSRTSQFIITGVNNSLTGDILTLNGNKSIQANGYGAGTFTGTAAYTLQVDASGNIIEGAVGAGVTTIYTGDGSLASNRTITNDGFSLTVNNNTATTSFAVNNTSTGIAIAGAASGASATGGSFSATANGGIGVSGTANNTNGIGIWGISNDGIAAQFNKNPSSTNTLVGVINIFRTTSGSTANGIGGSIDYYNEASDGSSQIAARIGSTWTDVTLGTRTGDLQFWTTNSATSAIKATLAGSGALRLHSYGAGSIGGTATFALSVDASGNVIETALGGAGFTNPMGAIGDIITSSDGAGTPVAISPGAAGTVLTSNGAGAQPTYQALAGSGTVTSVAQSFTGGLISVAGSPITGSGTLALTVAGTSGGGVYFSSASTWASTGELAANNIMIGGGAGAAYSTTTTGTGVLTALGVNVGSAGAFVVFDGALGTPSSGVATNLTGTAAALNIGGNAATASVAPAGTLTGTTLNATVVTSSLTTVGIIGAGTWQGTAIADTYISSAATWNAKQTGDATLTALAGLTITNGSIIYGTGADAFAVLAAGSNGQVLTLAGGVPTWSAAGIGTVTSVTGTANRITVATGTTTPVIDISSNYIGQGTITTVGTITSGTWNGSTIAVARGGTGLTSVTSATILIGNASNGWTQGTPTGSNGITITMGSGTFNISNVYNPAWQTLVDGSTITWTVANGANAQVTLAGTGRTLSIPAPVDGHTYTIRIIQGSGGSKTITTWPTGTKWQNGTAPVLSTTAGQYDVVSLKYQSSTGFFYGTYGLNFQ